MMMSDTLGGNAKTLMFVNISLAEINLEETNSSLGYATRVESITKEASRNIQSKEVLKLKKAITYWKKQAGKKFEGDDDLEEIQDTRPSKNKDDGVSWLFKLTMLMSDSLGGNAKTLMFVNISPAESNLEETHSLLGYETRVGSITNEASRSIQSKEVLKLKKSMTCWKEQAGKKVEGDDDLEQIQDTRPSKDKDDGGVNKSGSTDEQLKKAQSINKSLSTQGDVISPLATKELHIPYRKHKLIMLMSDTLGGNAKTLMFLNISLAQINLEKTQETHSSQGYVARVGSITNEASRNIQSKEVLKLKKAINYWKEQAGKKVEGDDDLEQIQGEYNVCMFIYGQTSSGKTSFTIYGGQDRPSVTPCAIKELFRCLKRDNNKFSFKDNKGMVVVENATFITVLNAHELESRVARGIDIRHVSRTQINAESSRSHLILSVVIESTNLQTQALVKGKLSFVDLASSERVNKSGSAGEQLKEAQSINNNLEETHSSLGYETSVASIMNEASQNTQSKEVLKLKKAITYWKEQAGKKFEGDNDLEAIQDTRRSKDKDDGVSRLFSSLHVIACEYNVFMFVYGQTSSGKMFTIYGGQDRPGLTPSAIKELFRCLKRDNKKFRLALKVYMLELYQDTLKDLLLPKNANRQKQDIKKDSKGMVVVENATFITDLNAQELESRVARGIDKRHVSGMQINAESSRSHLILSVVIGRTNLQTQALMKGKLSFVDISGLERVNKSGSAGKPLKEAQSINKSLSALGDVISALATKELHILYRNHKLTMLMSDTLGGSAKTLMFVNISLAEINLEETHSSLGYATREYNVSIFIYGQTSSGKTFTIYDGQDRPGLTPSAIKELFRCLKRHNNKFSFAVKVYMLELYQDTLKDLLLPKNNKRQKLDIKKDSKGMMVVENTTFITVLNAQELESRVARGIDIRHVSKTQINAESSRSHLILSVVIESTNLQTQALVKGKLSFVDLASSERVNKSGSVGEQLKEAQSFNKSQTSSRKTFTIYGGQDRPGLTPGAIKELFTCLKRDNNDFSFALKVYMLELYQDTLKDLLLPKNAKRQKLDIKKDSKGMMVVESQNATFITVLNAQKLESRPIPYRNPKLTMLMSDTLGGNAKTLMFVNISLAEINLEETHSSLGYGTRVESITNKASLNIQSKEVLKLKKAITYWKEQVGEKHEGDDDLEEIQDTRRSKDEDDGVSTNLQTQALVKGNLSFVNVAGSERLNKSGSAGKQLKEAQSINKLLSALGDVISSLATKELHIPYRNHKLTMLMSDTLCGKAKTLMFVDISLAEINLEETHSSLGYATRVELITNEASRNIQSKEVLKLKKAITY
ncbi:hypothetical protein CBR_g19121 [Chara braunii]|uniref:Kinesin motor domain-containing protein n=1 Tax=Chara braunii TaxID=69332 RepID=A0A388KXE6_CHABU|nr:hypothetical protein CBR_g19121 [Chara braunii]|eukprot:GBG74715.1 hypothetical protein CBR_g19121 [Chara braunii]